MKYLTLLILFIKLFYQASFAPSIIPNFNFMILGLDPRNDILEKTNTTDTIMLARLDSNWQLSLISIPRDLWYYPINAKINQIYPLSTKQPTLFPYIQNNFSDLTNLPIDRTIIVTTQNLEKFADLIGGVDVYLDHGFTDKQYPNPEYVKNPSAKIPIYITVNYPSGINHLDSTNIAPFVRSRHSAETAAEGGTDIGRTIRQQLLIEAIIKKIRSPEIIRNPSKLLSFYNFWHQEIQSNFTDLDFASLILSGKTKVLNLKINKIEIPTGEDKNSDILYHPQSFINPQWVFLPQDEKYLAFQKFIHQQFAILNY